MSHFSVLVVGDDHEAALQPFHEFECTGINDQYVKDVDQTGELREQYAGGTETRLRAPDGTLFVTYDDRFYREPTEEEKAKIGTGSGCGNGLSWTTKDWGDGKGYRTKVKFVPEDFAEVEVPTHELMSFRDWVADYTGRSVITPGHEPDLKDEHKYGYILVDAAGDVVTVVDRTNPNKKWDWYSIGGRYSGRLLSKTGQKANQLRVFDFDLNSAIAKNADNAAKEYDAITNCIGGRSIQPWSHFVKLVNDGTLTIDQARTDFHAQETYQDLVKSEVLDRFYGSEVLDKVLVTDRDTYIKNESEENATTWAFLHNGEWSERGSMGWFGMSDATGESTQTYVKKFLETIKSLPPETLLTVVDCHI